MDTFRSLLGIVNAHFSGKDQPNNGYHIIMRIYHRVPLGQLSEKKSSEVSVKLPCYVYIITYVGLVSLAVVSYYIRSGLITLR